MGGPKLVGPSSRKRTMLLLVEKVGQSGRLDDGSSHTGRHSIAECMTLSHRRSFFNARHFPLLALCTRLPDTSVCRRADLKGHGFINVILSGYLHFSDAKRTTPARQHRL